MNCSKILSVLALFIAVSAFTLSPIAAFAASEQGSGDGKCGEGKCGGEKKEHKDDKGEKKDHGDGKCGTGKCGASK